MKIHRFYLEEFSKQKKIELAKSPIFHQIKNVLRIKAGEEVSFFYNNQEAVYKIINIEKNKIIFDFVKDVINNFNIKRKINLYQSIIKKDKIEWVVQKASELGVAKIIPVISDRSEKKDVNIDRLNKIAVEASEQCGRQDIIEITETIKFKNAFTNNNLNILADVSGKNILDFLEENKNNKNPEEINIFIGPEGGWTESEIDFAKKNKAQIVSLNNYILRSETASVSIVSIFSNL